MGKSFSTRDRAVTDLVDGRSERKVLEKTVTRIGDNGGKRSIVIVPPPMNRKVPSICTHDLKQKDQDHIDAWKVLKRNIAGRDSTKFNVPKQEYFTHKKLIEKYPNESWIGKRCFIIGGGPSLIGFDFKQLDGELTIAVNRAFEYLDPSILFFMDNETYYQDVLNGTFGDEAADKFMTSQCMKISLNIYGVDYGHGVYSIPLSKTMHLTSDIKEGLYHGGNSGFAALNLAIVLGAKKIYLLGFDMKGDGSGKQVHFHSGYRQKQSDKVYKVFNRSFVDASPRIRALGVDVINLNPDSDLKCFEFGRFKDIDPKPGYDYHKAFDSKKVIPVKHRTAYFDGAMGIGDNFYQRPVIADMAKSYKTVYLTTAAPEIYWDIPNVKFVRPKNINLRTQKKHVLTLSKATWSDKPKNADTIRWDRVGPTSMSSPYNRIQTKYIELENKEDFDFSFPVKNEWIKAAEKIISDLPLKGKKLCIVRRPTIRKEWPCKSRNPKIEYYQLLMDKYKKEYFFLSIADIKDKHEWFSGSLKGIDGSFDKGELPLTTLLGLIKLADMTITYPCLFMIAAIAMRAKCFTIFGGIASPEHILRRNLGLYNFAYAAPDPACNCSNPIHRCNKNISRTDILEKFAELKVRPNYLKTVTIGTPPGFGDSYWVMTKMESFKERHGIDKLRVLVHRDPKHYYTANYLELVPFIDEVEGKPDTFHIGQFYRDKNRRNLDEPGFMETNTQGVDYLIDAGARMWIKDEKLIDIMPEYETNYNIPINLPESAIDFADLLKKKNDGKLVLFYTSSLGNNRNWNKGDFKVRDWMSLMEKYHEHSGVRPMAIGAEWDRDYFKELKRLDKNDIIQDYVGHIPIHQTISLIKRANILLGFACGIPMFGVYNKIPTVILWAIRGISSHGHFNPPFQYSWTPPGTKESGLYFPVAYNSKEATPGWIFNKTKRFL